MVEFDANSIAENSSEGHILEVELKCPGDFHEFNKYCPLAPEKPEMSHNMLSNYCSSITNKYDKKPVLLIN